MSKWICDKGHTIEQDRTTLNLPTPVWFRFGDETSKALCPYCLIDWMNENLPEMKEAKDES